MRYTTDSGLLVTDRRHSRADFDDPRGWPPNENVNPPPPTGPGTGPNMSEGFGNDHVMYPATMPEVQAWSGWPTEWNTPNWGGAAGVPEIMSKVSVVFGCVDMNSSILSTMPPYRLQDRKVIGSLPWMANPQPEVYTGWTEMMKMLLFSYYSGEAFLWCTNRYADGTVRNFIVLDPTWVDVNMIGHIRTYNLAGIDITEDVLHIRYCSWPGYPHGFGPLQALASTLFGIAAMEQYQANLAIRGGVPWGVLTAPGNLSQPQATMLRDNFVNARLSSMGAPAVLSGGVSLTPFNLTPKDMSLLELRQFDEARVSTLLGVPPLLMALPEGGTSMTYKNAEGIYDFHWRAFLRPKAATIMEAISLWALPSTQSVEMNRDDYVKPNWTERTNGYQILFNILDPVTGKRAITVDEIREAERLAVLDDALPIPDDITAPESQQTPPTIGNAISTSGGAI